MQVIVCALSSIVISAHLVLGCFPAGDSNPKLSSVREPIDDVDLNPLADGNDTTAEVWLGSISFVDFWCGIPDSSYIQDPSDDPDNIARRKRSNDANNNDGDDDKEIDLNTYQLDHSFVFFRGTCYEFGPGNQLVYARGGLNRKINGCPITWTFFERSACSLQQTEELSTWYQDLYDYNLLFNNCHHFSEWLLQRLDSEQCEIF